MKNFLRQHETLTFIPGPQGNIEAIFSKRSSKNIAIICHPDPQQQGTMFNKVVSTLARSFDQLEISTLRFNYRGIGQSQGSYGHVEGEIQDALSVHAWLIQKGFTHFHLAGFSFGSYIATAICHQIQAQSLTLIAPPVKRFDYTAVWPHIHVSIHQGLNDEIVLATDVINFAKTSPNVYCRLYENTGHFFHGKLLDLQTELLSNHV